MKLSKIEIEKVIDYVQSFDIKYLEIELELTDHLIESMEIIWTENPDYTFHQVKFYAEKRFGKNYFENIALERKQFLQKAIIKERRKGVIRFLSSSKILWLILAVFMVYKSAAFFGSVLQYTKYLSIFVILLPLINTTYILFNRKINGKLSLNIEASGSLASLGSFTFYGIMMLMKKTPSNKFHLLVFSIFFVLSTLVFLFGLKITHRTIQNTKLKYRYL